MDIEKIKNSDVIIVDDGVAIGYSLIAAIKSVSNYSPASITACVPISAYEAYEKIKTMVDNFVCQFVENPYFFAVASYYKYWSDLPENQILEILNEYKKVWIIKMG